MGKQQKEFGRLRMDSGQHRRVMLTAVFLGVLAFLPVAARLYFLMVEQYDEYSKLALESFDVTITNTFGAYLYPNQYVQFTAENEAIKVGQQLAYSANSDLDVVSNVYNYLITHVTYDAEKAETVESGYLPQIDETLASGKGICLDYAAVMSSMLRSQRIPTHRYHSVRWGKLGVYGSNLWCFHWFQEIEKVYW